MGGTNSLTITGNAVFGDGTADTVTGVNVLSVSGNTTIHTNTVTTTGTQTYGDNAASDTITLGNSTTLTTTNAQITINGIVNSESAEQNNLTLSVGTSEVEFNLSLIHI